MRTYCRLCLVSLAVALGLLIWCFGKVAHAGHIDPALDDYLLEQMPVWFPGGGYEHAKRERDQGISYRWRVAINDPTRYTRPQDACRAANLNAFPHTPDAAIAVSDPATSRDTRNGDNTWLEVQETMRLDGQLTCYAWLEPPHRTIPGFTASYPINPVAPDPDTCTQVPALAQWIKDIRGFHNAQLVLYIDGQSLSDNVPDGRWDHAHVLYDPDEGLLDHVHVTYDTHSIARAQAALFASDAAELLDQAPDHVIVRLQPFWGGGRSEDYWSGCVRWQP